MPEPEFGREFTDADDVADYIVGEFAAENKGVAEVIPSDEIRERLDEVLEHADGLDADDTDDFYVDVKDAVLDRDVVIA